jgi:GDP-L-fucose synthase
LANAVVYALENKLNRSLYNVGSGEEVSIKELASLIKNITGFKGEIIWDKTKPDGTPRKLLDSSIINKLGWNSRINLQNGVEMVYKSEF